MVLYLTTISPKRGKRRKRILEIPLGREIFDNDTRIRLNGTVPRQRPPNLSDEQWSQLSWVYRKLNLSPGHTIIVDKVD